jgi:membrane protein DedA with SNARE-associated domain
MNYIEQWGLLGVFIASVIPFVDAIAMVPLGIAFGLNPFWTVVAAVVGDSIMIFIFAYLGADIRNRIIRRRKAKGKSGDTPKFDKAIKAFDKYGIYGLSLLSPVLLGTQIAAAAAVAAGVKPFRAASLITLGSLVWSAGIAIAMVAFDINFEIV